jgi:HAD superfamily hydrolase (TIGR01509 family)
MKTDLKHIKNIIFDLGKVLLNLDFDASIKAFQDLGLGKDVLNSKQAYVDPVFYELETGKVTPQEFRNRIRLILNNADLSDQQIDSAWSAMILDIPPHRVELLKELKKKYKLYLFSNTNQIHIEGLWQKFQAEYGFEFSSLFVKDYYSHEIHERKPDIQSYEKVIALARIKPEETIFIDDLEKNIVAAQKAGLKTFWLKDGMEMAGIF